MVDRVEKRYRDTTRERKVLSASIAENDFEIMPCSRCWKAKPKRRCIMKEESNRCLSCVRMGKSCDGPSVADSCGCLDCVQWFFSC
ncbi:Putative protein of unknown function [Podospora comata]|uniref:Zn(2)-C6 fungal-type domain-containing protein n=1 Tax=Podospora comata TaxID=48703 RepID=A0ABY6S0D4_PODCO|nr:Putative protein of unknown function [Podospora comata]